MTTSIKITALTPIGANIAYTTLVPVVNMTGTPTTQKATAQVLGNLILNGAGGSYFPAAAQAVLAGTVTTAAQPNITSVGTLTSANVTGNLKSGNANLGNLAIANFFSGDGYLLSNLSSGSSIVNGTSNVRVASSGNVSTSVGGTANVLVVSTTGIDVNGNISVDNVVSTGGNLEITANGATWIFGQGGALYWPAGTEQWVIEPNIDDEFEIKSSSNVVISTDVSNANSHFTFDSAGVFTAPGPIVAATVKTVAVAFSGLPSASSSGAGTRGFITDANTTTFGSQVSGGGANSVPVYSNGTNWFVG
jgi:hypothetical protein